MKLILPAQIWQFRNFIFGSIIREIQARYKSSVFGAAWVVLPPLAQITIYTLIFSNLIGARLPGIDDKLGYSIYLCAGIISWSFFGEIVSKNTSIFLDNANLIKKVIFPRICLPIIITAGAAVNFLVMLLIFLMFLFLSGRNPDIHLIAVIPLVILQLMFAASIGMAVGVANVFFRDIGQLTNIILQFWFWLTPIVYPISILPDNIQSIVSMNPMTSIISGYQQVFLYHQWPDWQPLVGIALITVCLMLMALAIYRRNISAIVDEL